VRVPEATPAQVVRTARALRQRLVPPVTLALDASRRLVELLAAIPARHRIPGKGARVRRLTARCRRKTDVLPRRLTTTFGAWSGLPVDLLAPERRSTPLAIAAQLRKGVIGQDHACTVAGRVIARLKAASTIRSARSARCCSPVRQASARPSSPSSSRAICSATPDRLVRIDMSELTTPGAIARLITPSPAGTSLADRIRRQPLSVVLFDEIEKAADTAFDLLLGVLGEGRRTDAFGRLVDFRMSLIVMTTNLGAADPRTRRLLLRPGLRPRSVWRDSALLSAPSCSATRRDRSVPPASSRGASRRSSELEIDKLRNLPASSRGTCARAHRRRPQRARPARPRSEARRPPAPPARSKTGRPHRSPNGWRKNRGGATPTIRIATAGEPGDIAV